MTLIKSLKNYYTLFQVFQCCASLWGGIHVCAKYLELAEVEMSLWQAQPRVRWVSFGVIWSEDCLQRQDQHQSHLKIVRNMRESLWRCSCLQIQNPFVCKRCELKFKQSSVLKFHIITERINLVNPLWDLETVKLDGKIMLRLWWIVWRMAKNMEKMVVYGNRGRCIGKWILGEVYCNGDQSSSS